jgi:hypothetical protein
MNPKTTGTERTRDEQRTDGGPRNGGEPWQAADARGDERFGHVRNDDANPSELSPPAADNSDDDSPADIDPELATAEATGAIVGSAEHAGMGRGDHPAESKSRSESSTRNAIASPAAKRKRP